MLLSHHGLQLHASWVCSCILTESAWVCTSRFLKRFADWIQSAAAYWIESAAAYWLSMHQSIFETFCRLNPVCSCILAESAWVCFWNVLQTECRLAADWMQTTIICLKGIHIIIVNILQNDIILSRLQMGRPALN